MKYILYGFGKSNQALKKYLNQLGMDYYIVIDEKKDSFSIEESLAILKDASCIIKSPGIFFQTSFLERAKRLHVEIISDFELYYRLFPQKNYYIVTGSVGKTTTVYLLSRMVSNFCNYDIKPVGNVGNAFFNNIDETKLVVEASSFMLHHTSSVKPNVYVITNLFPHHLDYHLTFDNYYFDKTKLIHQIKPGGLLVYPYDDQRLRMYFEKVNHINVFSFSFANQNATCYVKGDWIMLNQVPFIEISELSRNENHNLLNMMASILVASYLNIDKKNIVDALKAFQGVKYRFQTVYHQFGITVINDSKSTTPVATKSALESVHILYPSAKKILILGGILKNESFSILDAFIKEYQMVYCFGASAIQLALQVNATPIKVMDKLEEVVNDLDLNEGSVVLFSPGCVSFDQYENFEKRGDAFNFFINDKLNNKMSKKR